LQPGYHLNYLKPKIKLEQPHSVGTQPIKLARAMAQFQGCFTRTVPRTKSCRTRTRTCTRTRTRTAVLCSYGALNLKKYTIKRA